MDETPKKRKTPLFPFFFVAGFLAGFVLAGVWTVGAVENSTDPQGIGPGGLGIVGWFITFPFAGAAVGIFGWMIYRVVDSIFG